MFLTDIWQRCAFLCVRLGNTERPTRSSQKIPSSKQRLQTNRELCNSDLQQAMDMGEIGPPDFDAEGILRVPDQYDLRIVKNRALSSSHRHTCQIERATNSQEVNRCRSFDPDCEFTI